MASHLFDRIGALLRADAHGVVDALEERSLVLRQHLRDAELELLQKRARVAALVEEEARLRDDQQRHQEAVASLDEDVRLALEGGKDELARFAVRRLLPERKELVARATQIAETCAAREKLAATLEEQEAAFQELVQRVRADLTRARDQRAGDPWEGVPDVAEEEIDLELLRRRGAEGAPA